MREFRLQEMVPQIYCDESRDFQMLCRAYDSVLNGVKFDIDSIKKMTDTMQIRESFLPLLQTKLGFFSKKQYNSTKLRYILGAFPTLVKNKGSMYAVKGAINAYIKAIGIEPNIIIWYTKTAISQNGIQIPDHSLIIGIEGQLEDLAILYDVFRYIIPTGIGYYFYFYETITAEDKLVLNDYANLVFVSDIVDSSIRGTVTDTNLSTIEKRLIGDADTMVIAPYNVSDVYMLLTEEPVDWATSKTRYYKLSGSSYVHVEAEDNWATNTYYATQFYKTIPTQG